MTVYDETTTAPDPDPTKVLDNWNWAATDPTYSDAYLGTCPSGNPFIEWAGRQWWINYWWNTQTGTYSGDSNYRSNFDPKQFFTLDEANDELTLRTFGTEPDKCITAEIVLGDLLGYGDYVLTVQAGNKRPFAQFDSNVCFGAFTYQFGISTDETNSHREIDMLETLSYNAQLRGSPDSNAQFTLQPANDSIIKRFAVPKDCSVVTLWLRRLEPGGIGDTVLSILNGSYSLEQILTDPTVPRAFYAWIPSQTGADRYLPLHTPESRERLHINLYLTPTQRPYRNAGEPPPSGEHSVTLTRFEFAQSRVWLPSVPINDTVAAPGTTPSYLSFVDANWFYLFFRGPDNKLMWCTMEFGGDWSQGQPLNELDAQLVTAFSPAAAEWFVPGPDRSPLYVFFVRPKDPANQIWFTVSLDGANWSPGKQLPTQDSTPTSPAAIYFNNKLYLFFKANDPSNRITYTTFDGQKWAPSQYINDAKDHTSAAPAVVYFNGGLYIFFKADDPSNRVVMCKPDPGGKWSQGQYVQDTIGPITTLIAPAAMVLDDKLCVFYTPSSSIPMKYCVGTPGQSKWTSQFLNSVDKPVSTPVGQGTGESGTAYLWFVPPGTPSEIRVSVGKPG